MILTYKLFLENLSSKDELNHGVGVGSNDLNNVLNSIKNNNVNVFKSLIPNLDKELYNRIIYNCIIHNNIDILKILFEYCDPQHNNGYALRTASHNNNALIVEFLLDNYDIDPSIFHYRAFLNTSDKIINLMIDHPKVDKSKLFNVVLNDLYEYDENVFDENGYLLKLLIRKYDILNPEKYNNISKLNPEDYDKWFELGLKKEYIENEN